MSVELEAIIYVLLFDVLIGTMSVKLITQSKKNLISLVQNQNMILSLFNTQELINSTPGISKIK